jgi:hypothetical protein
LNRHTWAALATVLTLIVPLAGQAQPATDPAPAPPQTEPATAAPAPAPAPMTPREKSQRVPHEKFAQVDTNHDGVISRDEAAAAPQLASRFDEVDADKDGRVTPAELKNHAKSHRLNNKGAGAFTKLDSNGDGVVTRDEVAANPKLSRKFEAADMDRDGRVTADEAKAARGK